MYTNNTGISLPLQIWLASDDYDHINDPTYISATSLLKSTRSLVLSKRLPPNQIIDLSDLIASRMGTAIHDSIEKAWKKPEGSLRALGYPEQVFKNVYLNPTAENLRHDPNIIPIYMELRNIKEINGFKIGGKFDFVADNTLHDFKSTGTYTYITGSNDEKYVQQGSIYRWLNQDIITSDHMFIEFIFTDWSYVKALADKSYPQSKVLSKKYNLMSIAETENFIKNKLDKIIKYMNADQDQIPQCTPEELWQSAPTWKYYRDPNKTTRATKNFDTPTEAYKRLSDDGNKGIVVQVDGEAKACRYCSARSICTQAEQLELKGLLK